MHSLPPDRSLESLDIEDSRVATSSLEALAESYHATSQLKDELASSSLRLHAETSTPSRDTQIAKAPNLGTPQTLRHTTWSQPSSQNLDLDGLYALRQAATLKAPQRLYTRSWSRRSLATLPDVSARELSDLCSFAAPLSPLRTRDLTVLSEFFLRDDMSVIEADISQRLISLLPEPCWEDEVSSFLKELL
jgi:hypothetical protein